MSQSGTESRNPHKPDYQAFLLRLWRVKEDGQLAWRVSLEQVDSGEKHGFSSLEELFAFIERFTQSTAGLNERRKIMWLNITSAKVAPENTGKALEILEREESRQPFREASGFRFLYVVESTENPGEVLSLSFWDSEAQGQAFYASDIYRKVLGGVAALISAPPERHFYEVRLEN